MLKQLRYGTRSYNTSSNTYYGSTTTTYKYHDVFGNGILGKCMDQCEPNQGLVQYMPE